MTRKDYPRICGNCKWFKDHDWDCGDCKRYPKTVQKLAKDWCGEFAIVREPKVYEVMNE